MEPKIFNYSESTYGVNLFGATKASHRIDITYYVRIRSRNAFLQRLLKLPHMHQTPLNWIRERICKGSGGMESIITDDSIYVLTDHNKIIGKFRIDGKWIRFNPPKKPYRPWLEDIPKPKKEELTTKQVVEEELNLALNNLGIMELPFEEKADLLRVLLKILRRLGVEVE